MTFRNTRQNQKANSTAVMARRHASAPDELDFFPTPYWATRALCEWLTGVERKRKVATWSCWEPAAGGGHMVRVLEEYFRGVHGTDIADHGAGFPRHDFLAGDLVRPPLDTPVDWVITNPPFQAAEDFFHAARSHADYGVALLCRTAFAESRGRFNRLFSTDPPTHILQFVDCVSMTRGELVDTAQGRSATAYAWFVWRVPEEEYLPTRFHWLPHREIDWNWPPEKALPGRGQTPDDDLTGDALRRARKSGQAYWRA